MRCPYCESEENVKKNGFSGNKHKKRLYHCSGCKKSFTCSVRKNKWCPRCGYPLTDGKCTECFQPLIQYHNVDREVKLYI